MRDRARELGLDPKEDLVMQGLAMMVSPLGLCFNPSVIQSDPL